MSAKIVPIILSGGSGSRLWPLSRELYPKQFLPLASDDGRTLLQETALRASGEEFADPIVICNEKHRFLVAEQLRTEDITPAAIVLEPMGRNTAPAAAIAAMLVKQQDPDAVMFLLASGHVIAYPDAFRIAAKLARDAAVGGSLTALGIKPDAPETGFGYIKSGPAHSSVPDCCMIERFVEKPDLETAKQFLADGSYYWNASMFMFSPSQYLEELGRHNPEMVSVCEQALEKAGSDQDFIRLDSDIFATCPSDSIDYAVMEHTENAAVVPVDLGWSDVGAWPALWEIGKRDENDNVIHGDVITLDTHGSYIRSEGSTVATNGIDDLIVVATDDAVLVADKSRAQDVKAIVERIKAEGRNEHETHTTVHRPWGWYQTINLGSRFQVKQICLKPHATISLQMHHHRAEHWVVVEGNARVTRNEEVVDLAENQSTYIPIGTTHRLENPHDELLRIIEVQSGSYLGEDDIVRFDDVYGRT